MIKQAVRVLEVVRDLAGRGTPIDNVKLIEGDIGGAALDESGGKTALSQNVIEMIENGEISAVLLGAVGGPQWSQSWIRPEQGLLQLRKLLDCFANIRPCQFPAKSLVDASPLKAKVVKNVDFIVVRELVGGIYFGESGSCEDGESCYDTMTYSRAEIERVTRVACKLARIHSQRTGQQA